MNFRPRAEVFIFKRNNILCAYTPTYVCFPGGGIDKGENAREAAIREGFEEAGRRVINCTVAHPPTHQIWSKQYKKQFHGAEGYDGGITFWMTGSSSDTPVSEGERHKDYMPGMNWHPVKEVISKLKSEQSGDWADDVRVRLKILQTHLQMQERHKTGSKVGKFTTFTKFTNFDIPAPYVRLVGR
jgi:8-oxo-dGTP pyrophosphatase MutT (NUDIX family)